MNRLLAIAFAVIMLSIVAAVALVPRDNNSYFSAEDMRRACEPDSCVLVPMPLWHKIVDALKSRGAI